MDSIDTDLVLLVGLTAFAIFVLVTIWRYVATQSRKGLVEQERELFGHALPPESREFMAVVVPRFASPLGFVAAIVVVVVLGLAKVLGYL